MDSVLLESKENILMGDFNIDLSKANKLWTETFSLFNLSQIIDSPTRVPPHLEPSSITSTRQLPRTSRKSVCRYLVPVTIIPFAVPGQRKALKYPN